MRLAKAAQMRQYFDLVAVKMGSLLVECLWATSLLDQIESRPKVVQSRQSGVLGPKAVRKLAVTMRTWRQQMARVEQRMVAVRRGKGWIDYREELTADQKLA